MIEKIKNIIDLNFFICNCGHVECDNINKIIKRIGDKTITARIDKEKAKEVFKNAYCDYDETTPSLMHDENCFKECYKGKFCEISLNKAIQALSEADVFILERGEQNG